MSDPQTNEKVTLPDNLVGKRMLFAMVAIVCATVAAVALKWQAQDYSTLFLAVVGAFMTAQSLTDLKGK